MPQDYCIEPKVGEWLRALNEESIEHSTETFSFDPAALPAARFHWNSCPACRHSYPQVSAILDRVKLQVEERAKTTLLELCSEFHSHRLEKLTDASAYAGLIGHLVQSAVEVQWALGFVVGGITNFTAELTAEGIAPSPDRLALFSATEFRADSLAQEMQHIDDVVPLSTCADFIAALRPDVQQFVFEAVLAHDLLRPEYRKIFQMTIPFTAIPSPDGEFKLEPNDNVPSDPEEFICRKLRSAILDSGIAPESLYGAIQSAAKARVQDCICHAEGISSGAQQRLPGVPLPAKSEFEEFKREFADSVDSLKAGQMEVMRRLIDHNSRSAAAYEPDIAARMGDLYPRLSEKTRRLLQVAEYLYHINQTEPNYFHGPVNLLALAYENELLIRVIWPYVAELLASGTETYDCRGSARTPLIAGGSVHERDVNLGNLKWYLIFDDSLRKTVSALGFAVDAISNDAAWLTKRRNIAAHQPVCERAVADEVRQQMLRNDGMLARLHPVVARAADIT